MQVVLHAGVHCTDEDRLLKCLLRNTPVLREQGVVVPGPGKYRKLLSDIVRGLAENKPLDGARDVVLEAMLDDDEEHVSRVILSDQNFFAWVTWCLNDRRFYNKAEMFLRSLCQVFEGDEVELFLGLRDPATFIPAAFAAARIDDYDLFMRGAHPLELSWAELIGRIKATLPQLSVTVWCNEDTPLIWGQVIREIGGLQPTQKISGAFDLLAEIMEPEGMKRFRAYLGEHPMTEMQRRRVMVAFLDKYAIDEEIEEVLDLPGWDQELVAELSASYDEDLEEIARIPGVTVIAP